MTDCVLLKNVQQALLKMLREDVPISLRDKCPPLFGLASRLPNIWNPVDNRDCPRIKGGDRGSFNLRIGYYLNTVEAVKADGEPELLSVHVIFDTP